MIKYFSCFVTQFLNNKIILSLIKAHFFRHINPKPFCDQVSSDFRKTFSNFNIENDDFIRTTEERHTQTVKHVWNELNSKGYLHKKLYESWYCVQDESFLTEHQIDVSKKISLESGHPVEWAQEENYVFKLEHFRERIR